MIELFSGTATLCSVSKQHGMGSSMALDKIRKRGAKTTIFVLDILSPKDRELLYHWAESPLLVWVHMAPVCGTCSRAREIRNGGPQPLRSDRFPMGLPDLSPTDQQRVNLANSMYTEACKFYELCYFKGILLTLENPSNSIFWLTQPFLRLLSVCEFYFSDTQMCMMGGSRPKWTRLAANFAKIADLNVECDGQHPHAAWGKTFDALGRQVYATSLEAEYPRRFCVSLVQCVVQQLQTQNMLLPPTSLIDIKDNEDYAMQTARISAQQQSRKSSLPPLIPEHSHVAVFVVQKPSDIPVQLSNKLACNVEVFTKTGLKQTVPKSSRFLRRSATTSPFSVTGGLQQGDECFEVAFGIPWTIEGFMAKAVQHGHPANFCKLVPKDIQDAVEFHVEHSHEEVSRHRMNWCKRWLQRAKELGEEEQILASRRHSSTARKRLLLTREILESLEYEDMEVLSILEHGSTLAGEVNPSTVFQASYKPCLTTVSQLSAEASERNQLVMSMTKSSGDRDLDASVLQETMEEVNKGWADGPWQLKDLEEGATISRRFPLKQGDKIRMIDDYSVSGVNDSCTIHTKLDLHVIDTFAATIKSYFAGMKLKGNDMALLAKTYDLKSAYRQIPVRPDNLKFAYFCIYKHELDEVQIFRSRTLPFGATHSVYSFLRLARMLRYIACRGGKLLTTNFYDDFILASHERLQDSSRSCMELVFMFTGWAFAQDGRKATSFSQLCSALGVTFNLHDSLNGVLEIQNTERRIAELVEQLSRVLADGKLPRSEALRLRGRLGFADGFLHGRLGALVLKRLIDHAYGATNSVDTNLANILSYMKDRLQHSKPKRVDTSSTLEWCVYTDAAFESSSRDGGIGGVLVAPDGSIHSWFSCKLDSQTCEVLGADLKDTIIYELEMLATCVALELWSSHLVSSYPVHYGDNDAVRFAMIRGTGLGIVAESLMKRHLQIETIFNTNVWFARVPTEANIADYPSRMESHPLLTSEKDMSSKALESLGHFLSAVKTGRAGMKRSGGGQHPARPKFQKKK